MKLGVSHETKGYFTYVSVGLRVLAGEGYEVRPYSDFGSVGKLIKTSILLRQRCFSCS